MAIFLKNKWYWMALLMGTVVFYVLNLNTPMRGDDYVYALIPGNITQRCDTLSKYFASMHYFYIDTNGRISDMMGRFFISLLGKGVFNIFNTVIFAIFIDSLSCLITHERKLWFLSCIFLYIFLLFPWPGQTTLWLSGSVNYLWSSTATLLVLRYMINHEDGKATSSIIARHIALFITAFIAGGMNESISFATLAGMGGYFLFNFKKWRGTNITITLAYMLGACIIIASPAAWNRLEAGNSVNLHMSFIHLILNRGNNLLTKTCHFITPLLGIITICVILKRRGLKYTASDLFNWILAGTVLSVIIFGVYEERAYTWYSIAGLIIFARIAVPYITPRKVITRYTFITGAVACLCLSGYAISTTHANTKRNNEAIAAVLNSSDGVVKAYQTRPKTRCNHTLIFNNDELTCYNEVMGYYFHKDNVAFISEKLLNRYHDSLPFLHGGKRINFESDHPQWACDIYAFDGENYCIMPIECDSVSDHRGFKSKLFYKDIEAHVGTDRAKQRKFWGKMRNHEPYYHYHLKRDGKLYVILPTLNDSITRIEIPIKSVNGYIETLTFNHK